uniref:Conserved Oligomeric Golgi complex subunit 6 C-terminal domain-containing protein n=1 Tax=Clytia hemisphaerica TaxID=252671 RepID=A0A7M5XM40_9CNID
MDLPPPDLSPSQVVNETLSLLKEVLSSHDTAVSSVSEQQSAYEKIMNCLLDPLLQCCMVAANRMNSADSATYMINCLHNVETCLGVFEFTDVKLDVLSTQIAIHVETLAKGASRIHIGALDIGNTL